VVRNLVCFAGLISLGWVIGCSPNVVDDGGSGSGSGGGGGGGGGSASTSGSSNSGTGQGDDGPYPTPCHFLRGTATLTSRHGDSEAAYEAAAFSFEFASHDESVTYNDYDVLYEQNSFEVNTVTDDKSFIVDLGDVALEAAPSMVDPSDYAKGGFGTHDDLQAIVDHTYWVRTKDSSTEQVAVFRVTELAPGQSVTIDWMRSLDPDSFEPPVECP
jgi:hypothetical protein